VLVEASRLQERQIFGPGGHVDRSILFGAVTEGGGSGVSGSVAGPVEEVVVTDSRLPDPPAALVDASNPAPTSGWLDLGRGLAEWKYFDHLIAGAGLAMALLEPTPLGEAVLGSVLLSESRALSTIRLTHAGETFRRYESGNALFSRVTSTGGVKAGTYAAPWADGLTPLTRRASVYNLPDPMILRTETFMLRPPPNSLVVGPRPVVGGTGNEVLFPWGF
jgi:hypothetical protein